MDLLSSNVIIGLIAKRSRLAKGIFCPSVPASARINTINGRGCCRRSQRTKQLYAGPRFSPKGHRACPVGPSSQDRSGATAATSASDAKVQVFDPKAEVHVPGQWNHPLVPACRKFRAPAFRPSKLRPAGKAPPPCGFHSDARPGSMKGIGCLRPAEKRKSGRAHEGDRSSRNQI